MKKFGLAIAAAAFGLLLTACDSPNKTETEVKNAVLEGLKDPESAKFGAFKLVGSEGACLVVNARNSFGGYGGDKQALVMKLQGQWVLVSTESVSQEQCVDIVQKLLTKRSTDSSR